MRTKEQIELIRKRVNAATPGPWEIYEDQPTMIACQEHFRAPTTVGEYMTNSLLKGKDGGPAACQKEEDASFIAASRTDIPRLLALIEKQDAVIEWYRDVLKSAEAFLSEGSSIIYEHAPGYSVWLQNVDEYFSHDRYAEALADADACVAEVNSEEV